LEKCEVTLHLPVFFQSAYDWPSFELKTWNTPTTIGYSGHFLFIEVYLEDPAVTEITQQLFYQSV